MPLETKEDMVEFVKKHLKIELGWECSLCGKKMSAMSKKEAAEKQKKHIEEECKIAEFLRWCSKNDVTMKDLKKILKK